MQCKFCGFGNGEDDHRCLRCGRRVAGTAVAAPAGYVGALALAPEFDPNMTQDLTVSGFFPPLKSDAESRAEARAKELAAQLGATRGPGRLIQFDQYQKQAQERAAIVAHVEPPVAPTPVAQASQPALSMAELRASGRFAPQKPAPRKEQPKVQQEIFDFNAAKPEAPTLKTGVQSQVLCEHAVAKRIHRCLAGAVDAATIVIGYGLFLLIASLMGASFGTGKILPAVLVGMLGIFGVFYGAVCLIMRHDTPGMNLLHLQLVTFDGHPVDARDRAIRFMTSIVSIGAAGLGLIWALADEETLTWHDHISKTFPTERDHGSSYFNAGPA